MRRLVWLIDQSRWGWAGVAAAALFALAATIQLAVLPSLQLRLKQAAAAAARPSQPARAPAADPMQQLQMFYRHFNTGDALPDHLAKLYEVAQAHGITLRVGEYRLVRVRDAKLMRYQVTLPILGAYPDVRRFVAAALEALPVAALDHVSFERKRIDEGMVDAQIRLTFYLPET